MGRLLWLAAALGAAGCGKVSLIADAAVDAPDPDAFSCPAAKTACFAAGASTCVDPMADKMNCGGCGIACGSAEDCAAGHCADTTANCFTIKSFHPDATDGIYTHALDGSKFYCDMTNGGITYSSLSIGQSDVAQPGYTMISLTDFQTVAAQNAFIALMNAQPGALRIGATWTSTNCCIKYGTAAGQMLAFGTNNFIEPSDLTGTLQCNTAATLPAYTFSLVGSQPQLPPLPADFFATHAPVTFSCGEGSNPAFFWKKSV